MRKSYEPARPYSAAHPYQQGARRAPAQASNPVAPVAQNYAAPNPVVPAPVPVQQMAAEVARFFHELRLALQLSPVQAAQALSTRVDIVAALEAGRVSALPPWPETCRIVRTYAGFAGLDPRPVLYSLEQIFVTMPRAPVPAAPRRPRLPNLSRQGAPLLKAFSGGGRGAALKAIGGDGGRAALKALGGGGRRAAAAARNVRDVVNEHAGRPGMALFTVTMGVALILLITQTAVLEAAVSQLPPSMKRIVRGAQNYVIVQFAPVRDGLRWIDVPDPRTRRSDKLQTTAQSD